MKLVLIAVFITIQLFTFDVSKTVEVNLSKITGKSRAEIQNILGKPLKTEWYTPDGAVCSCQRTYYVEDKIAITFIDGKADWIWVYQGIELSNINSARIAAFHNFDSFTLIKVATLDNDCCVTL